MAECARVSAAGGAFLPAAETTFQGYIAHLYYAGEHHRFAAYTRGTCALASTGRDVSILLTRGDKRLRITASQTGGAELVAPHRGQMIHTIKEGLFGRMSFHLEMPGGTLSDQSSLAGIELVWEKGERQA